MLRNHFSNPSLTSDPFPLSSHLRCFVPRLCMRAVLQGPYYSSAALPVSPLEQRTTHRRRRLIGVTCTAFGTAKAPQFLSLASLAVISLCFVSPAGAKPDFREYVSVQQRQQQRSPLQPRSKAQSEVSNIGQTASALSISQQACATCCG